MSDTTCPYAKMSSVEKKATYQSIAWYESIKQSYLFAWFICSGLFVSIFMVYVWLGKLTLGIACLFSVIMLTTLFFVMLVWYSKKIRATFWTVSAQGRIPACSLFRVVFDIFMRPKILLRDIDLERMNKLGDLYLMFIGFRPAIVVTTADLAETISKDYDLFSKSDPRDLNMPYFFKWVGNNNVVLANGETWRRIREYIHPMVNKVYAFAPIFNQKALFFCEILKEMVNTKEPKEIHLTRWLKAVSLDSAGMALFGFEFKHLQELRNPGIDAMDYIINEIFDPVRIALPIKNRLPLESNRRLEKCMEHLNNLVLEMVGVLKTKLSSDVETNVLEMLLHGNEAEALSVDELRNNIVALVLASHETTQVSLGAVLYYLAKYPLLQEQLRAESTSLFPDLETDFAMLRGHSSESARETVYHKIQTFHTMGNFILESLRLYSPLANQNPRTTTRDTILAGYHIPKGTLININIHAIHMNPKEWNNPELFDPCRFNKGVSENKYSYLPFGAGPRLCSGRNFSLIEQKIVLCYILRYFKLTLPTPDYQVPLLRGSFTGLTDESFRLCFERIVSEDLS